MQIQYHMVSIRVSEDTAEGKPNRRKQKTMKIRLENEPEDSNTPITSCRAQR